MGHHDMSEADFGTGEKKFGPYLIGFLICSLLTLFSFWAVMTQQFSRFEVLTFIFSSAVVQFLVQVIFFLRLTTQTPQGKMNIMTLLFTGVILVTLFLGTLVIMWSLNYYMAH